MTAPTITADQDSQIPAINEAFRSQDHLFTLTVDYAKTTGFSLYLRGGHVPGTTTTLADPAALTMPTSATFYVDADPSTYALALQTGSYTAGRVKIGTGTTNAEGLVTWLQDSTLGVSDSGGGGGGGSGSVTSVALALPSSILTVAGSPVTSSGTLSATLATQAAHAVWAGPSSGSAAVPTFRALVASDLPAVPLTTGVSGILPIANGGTGTTTPGIVAGSNIIVSGAWPNQTVNATVSGGSGGGTVTSVAATVPSFLSVAGSPITGAGTLAVTYSGTPLPVANGGTGTASPGLVAGANVTVSGTWPNQTIAASASGGGFTSPLTTKGDLHGYSTTDARVPVGTNGQVLTADSAQTTGVKWATPAAGAGALVLVGQQTAANSATLDITSAITSAYDEYEIHVSGVIPSSSGAAFNLLCSADNGATWDTTSGNYGWMMYAMVAAGGGGNGSDNAAALTLANNVTSSAGNSFACKVTLTNPQSTSLYRLFFGFGNSTDTSRTIQSLGTMIAGKYRASAAVNALRFLFSAGNIASGTVRLYGIAKS